MLPPYKWDIRGLRVAREVASWSKDPSTGTGCYISDDTHAPVSNGFNGFPRGILDDHRLEDREVKLEMILHAEVNAVLQAAAPLVGCTAYIWPFGPCIRCAALLIQAGVKRVVFPNWVPPRWHVNFATARNLLTEAGVDFVLINKSGQTTHMTNTSEEPCLPSI